MPRVKHFGDRIVEDLMQAGESWKKGLTMTQVDTAELEQGIGVELEHTRDAVIAMKIALDHLAEHESGADDFDRYYTGLSLLEQILKKGRLDAFVDWAGEELGMKPKLRPLSQRVMAKLSNAG